MGVVPRWSRPFPAAERHKNKAHGVSRGEKCENEPAPEGRKSSSHAARPSHATHTPFRTTFSTTNRNPCDLRGLGAPPRGTNSRRPNHAAGLRSSHPTFAARTPDPRRRDHID